MKPNLLLASVAGMALLAACQTAPADDMSDNLTAEETIEVGESEQLAAPNSLWKYRPATYREHQLVDSQRLFVQRPDRRWPRFDRHGRDSAFIAQPAE